MSETPSPSQPLDAPAPNASRTSRPPVRMRTMVIGLVALAISVTTLLNQLTSIEIPAKAVTLTVLIGAGGLLLASGILSAVREQRVHHELSDPYGPRS